MKKLFLIVCLFYFLLLNINGQDKPTAEEEQAAKNLAAAFFNRFQETQDLAPLIEEFFVKDYARRLKFCETIGECDGNTRDFGQEKKEFTSLDVTETDCLRLYAISINYFFLYYRSIDHLNNIYSQKMINSQEEAEKLIDKELKMLLKDNPQLVETNIFNASDEESGFKFKTSNEFRKLLSDYEKFIAALKLIEAKLQTDFRKKNKDAKISFSPTDFRVYIEEKRSRLLDYPVGTRMFQVWGESDSVFFVMDLIEEDGKLKIVVIFPPMN